LPGEQISRWFLFLSEHLSASNYPGAAFSYAAASWAEPWRVIVKAEVMAAGDNPRFVREATTNSTVPELDSLALSDNLKIWKPLLSQKENIKHSSVRNNNSHGVGKVLSRQRPGTVRHLSPPMTSLC
jgi:hypothetical protein